MMLGPGRQSFLGRCSMTSPRRVLGAICLVAITVWAAARADDKTKSPAASTPVAGEKLPPKAISVLEQAEKSATNIKDEAHKAFALMKIATAWAKLGQFRQAAR